MRWWAWAGPGGAPESDLEDDASSAVSAMAFDDAESFEGPEPLLDEADAVSLEPGAVVEEEEVGDGLGGLGLSGPEAIDECVVDELCAELLTLGQTGESDGHGYEEFSVAGKEECGCAHGRPPRPMPGNVAGWVVVVAVTGTSV